jgi:phosphohistidine phosphatase
VSILLVRHAEAVPERPGVDDGARWLSLDGRAQVRAVAERAREQQLMPSRVFASPRVRAVQTAELFMQVLGFSGAVEVLPALCYTLPPERAARELAALDQEAVKAGQLIAAFGHMPTISQIVTLLTKQPQRSLGLAEARLIQDGRVVWSGSPS